MSVLTLYSSDLMLISRVGGVARAAGWDFESRTDTQDADDSEFVKVFLDLGCRSVAPSQLVAIYSAATLERAVTFGPHVHVDLLESARKAGFGTVVSRGSFMGNVAAFLARVE